GRVAPGLGLGGGWKTGFPGEPIRSGSADRVVLLLQHGRYQSRQGGRMRTSAMRRPVLLTAMLALLTFAEGCRAVEGIFKAGFWVGLIVAAIVVAIVVAIVKAVGG